MLRSPIAPLLTAALLVACAPVARAQYMYLDSNGDGFHTTADGLASAGKTYFDVWLATDRNRDGSAATCSSGPQEFSIVSYEFCLRAEGGNVSFADFVTQAETMTIRFGQAATSSEFYAGYGGATINPPGVYRLASMSATVSTGTPSLSIVEEAPSVRPQLLVEPRTEFGSGCLGLLFDHTLRLGQDWFDVDGLPSIGSPPANHPPVLDAAASVALVTGDRRWEPLTASDGDAEPLAFSLVSGPPFAEVTTEEAGNGNATGRLHLSPRTGDVGAATVILSVTDGEAEDTRQVSIQVGHGGDHAPHAALPGAILLPAGASRTLLLQGGDVDGQPLHFSLDSPPDFASLVSLPSAPGAGAGRLRISTSLCDAGDVDLRVVLTDGVKRMEGSIRVSVRETGAITAPQTVTLPTRRYPGGMAGGDLDGDGLMDLVVANEFGPTISVFRALGDGAFAAERTYPTGASPGSVALADFDEDGNLDAAVTCRIPSEIRLFYGNGDGTFRAGPNVPSGPRPEFSIPGDVDRDGHVDLVVANGGSNTVGVYRGTGLGTLGAPELVEVDGPPYGVALADFDGDGAVDVVSANSFSGTISFLSGFGDGTYRERRDLQVGKAIFSLAVGDWDEDGDMDLAAADFDGRLYVLAGDGRGGFTPTDTRTGYTSPQSVTACDLDLDGHDDLVLADVFGGAAHTYLGDGRGSFRDGPRFDLPRGGYHAAVGDVTGDRIPDLAVSDLNYGAVQVFVSPIEPSLQGFARAFVPGDHRPVVPSARGGPFCLRVQPVAGSFDLADFDPGSVTLASSGTGSVDVITAIDGKGGAEGDRDRDGIAEAPVCFAQADLGRLVDQTAGRSQVTLRLEGALRSGRRFCTPVAILVGGGQQPRAAVVSPNPLNPAGVLSFDVERRGRVRVEVFDLSGRLVRVLADDPAAEVGTREIPIDGRDRLGRDLASGVYFYRIDSPGRIHKGRFTILR